MDRRLYLAQFGAHNATDELLKAALEAGAEPHEVLYLSPSPRKLRDTEIRFAQVLARKAFIPPAFLTPRQLALELHRRYGSTRTFAAELKPLLVQRLLDQGSRYKPTFGYAQAVGHFIRDLKSYVAIRPTSPHPDLETLKARLERELAGFEVPAAQALDALEVSGRYNSALRSQGWSDEEDIMAEAPGHIEQRLKPPGVLVLDGFIAPNLLEQAIIAALIERAGKVLCLGYADPDGRTAKDNVSSYRLADRFVQFIRSQGSFRDLLIKGEPRGEPPLYGFPTLEDELVGVARSIKDQGRTGAAKLENFAVVVPKLDRVAPLLSRTFIQYGIPFTVYPNTSLAASPPITAVLELLTALDTGYERIATVAALSSPFLPGLLELPGDKSRSNRHRVARHRVARDRAALVLNRHSRQAGIIKDRANWTSIAQRLSAAGPRELDDEAEALWLAAAHDLEARVQRAIGMIDKLAVDSTVSPVSGTGASGAAPDSGQRTPGSLTARAQRLKQLLEASRFCGNADTASPHRSSSSHSDAVDAKHQLYDILDSLAEFEADFGPPQPAAVATSEFVRILGHIVRARTQAPERISRGVSVLEMTETIGLHPERLWFCCLTEPDLPDPYPLDPILPDRIRRELGMPDINWHQDWQRLHFHRTVDSSLQAPFLSFHESDAGRPVLPTPFIESSPLGSPKPAGPPNRPFVDEARLGSRVYSKQEEQLLNGALQAQPFLELVPEVDFESEPEVLRVLASRFGPEIPLPVTSLESYRSCPYRFYLEKVLGFDTPPEPTYDIDVKQWGMLIHRALGMLYARGPVALEDLTGRARACLEKALAEFKLPQFWAEVTRRVFGNLLPDFLGLEAAMRAEGFQPLETELRLQGRLGPELTVRARPDRVDASRASLRVIDYKTGSTTGFSGRAVLRDRTHIQLPIYARLLRDRFKDHVIDNFGVYSLRDSKVVWFANRKFIVPELIQAAVENAREIAALIRKGRFPATPGASGSSAANPRFCRSCSLAFTCGFQPIPIRPTSPRPESEARNQQA